jgi:hypothetical protein
MITKLLSAVAILGFAAPTLAAEPAPVVTEVATPAAAEVNPQVTDKVAPAANGLRGSYVGAGAAIGINGQGSAVSILGRLDIKDLDSDFTVPLSFRPQVTFSNYSEAALGLTYDIPVASKTNLYVGGGVAFREAGRSYWWGTPQYGILTRRDSTVGYVQAGAEKEIVDNVVLFTDLKYGLGNGSTLVPTVGAAWRF